MQAFAGALAVHTCNTQLAWQASSTELGAIHNSQSYDCTESVRNTIYNGGACHWFDNVREMIFEGNTCIGNEATANGNNIDSYGGGYSHHIYLRSVTLAR